MAGARVHIVMPQELVERIDASLAEGQSRGEWVRGAVERALGSGVDVRPPSQGLPVSSVPAPSEQLSRAELFKRATQK